MQIKSQIADKVKDVYDWIHEQLDEKLTEDESCQACSKCCNFTEFEHRLYITTPELMYFRIKMGRDNLKEMSTGTCPYLVEGNCSVHEHRFAGCRIFHCKASEEIHSEIYEESIRRFKEICIDHLIPYKYQDLPTSLNFLKRVS